MSAGIRSDWPRGASRLFAAGFGRQSLLAESVR